eukprot:gene24548-biopygen1385
MPAPRPRHARATPAPLQAKHCLQPAPRPRHARATVLFPLGWPTDGPVREQVPSILEHFDVKIHPERRVSRSSWTAKTSPFGEMHHGRHAVAYTKYGKTAADADRTRTGRGPHDIIQRNERGPDAGSAVSPIRGVHKMMQCLSSRQGGW